LHISDEAMQLLADYAWPGNVRELANLIERLMVIRPNGAVSAADLPWPIAKRDERVPGADAQKSYPEVLGAAFANASEVSPIALPTGGVDLKEYLAGIERSMIENALVEADGVVQRAADLLGIGRTTLVEKIRRYEIKGNAS
jgi:sigma-54 specific flagellar transcriptional regulator A